MGVAPEKPQAIRPLDLPNIPDFVVAYVVILEKSQMQMLKTTRIDHFQCLFGVLFAEHRQQISHGLAHLALLVAAEL